MHVINKNTDVAHLRKLLAKFNRHLAKSSAQYVKQSRHLNRKIARLKKSARKRHIRSRIKKYRAKRRKIYSKYRANRRYYIGITNVIRNRITRLTPPPANPTKPTNPAKPSPGQPAQPSTFETGVFMPNPYTELPYFERLTGKKTKIFLWYQSISEDFDTGLASWLHARGTTLQLAFEPHNFAKDANNQPEYRLKTITNGDHDGALIKWANQIKNFGHPVYFRLMCEMNGNWVAWGGNANGNSPADYIPAWRHIRNIFNQQGANNAVFVWAPNRDGDVASAQSTFNQYYPGDDYVDYVGINGYNWGTMYNTPTWTSRWQSFSEIFDASYEVYTSRTNKPLMIPEMASTEVGGSKAEWIKDAYTKIKYNYPRIKIAVWFNINKETDWRVHNSSTNLDAFIRYAF